MKTLSNRRGQVAVEYILMLVVMMALIRLVSSQIKSQEFLAEFAAKPWAVIAGVIENGVPGTPARTKEMHPNMLYRHASMKGKRER